MDKYSQAASLIRQFEGYETNPYWDKTAYRAGYGSDTTTLADGRIVKITPNMTVTQEDSNRDLVRRVQSEFAPRLEKQFGSSFSKLPENAQAALISMAYQQGSISDKNLPSLSNAIRTGDLNKIAQEIRQVGSLKNRRNTEADYLLNKLQVKSDKETGNATPQPTQFAPIAAPTLLNSVAATTPVYNPMKTYTELYSGNGYADLPTMNKLFGM